MSLSHCFVSRWRGLEQTLNALTFFVYSCWQGCPKTALSAGVPQSFYLTNAVPNSHYLRSTRPSVPVRRMHLPSLSAQSPGRHAPMMRLPNQTVRRHRRVVVIENDGPIRRSHEQRRC
jgi:hypothetical protein